MAVMDTPMGSVNYSDEGTGIVLVFLHGYLESIKVWDDFKKMFANNFRIICIDLPGHGNSTIHFDMITMEDMAIAVKTVLSELKVQKYVVIGHSMGGYVALSLAELYPESLSGLIMLNSHPNPDSKEKISSRIEDVEKIELGLKDVIAKESIPKLYANDNLKTFSAWVEKSMKIAFETSDTGIIAALRGMAARKDRNFVVGNLAGKVLMIFGQNDNLIPLAAAQSISARHNQAKTIWLKNSGHMGFVEESNQTATAITSFLTELFERV